MTEKAPSAIALELATTMARKWLGEMFFDPGVRRAKAMRTTMNIDQINHGRDEFYQRMINHNLDIILAAANEMIFEAIESGGRKYYAILDARDTGIILPTISGSKSDAIREYNRIANYSKDIRQGLVCGCVELRIGATQYVDSPLDYAEIGADGKIDLDQFKLGEDGP